VHSIYTLLSPCEQICGLSIHEAVDVCFTTHLPSFIVSETAPQLYRRLFRHGAAQTRPSIVTNSYWHFCVRYRETASRICPTCERSCRLRGKYDKRPVVVKEMETLIRPSAQLELYPLDFVNQMPSYGADQTKFRGSSPLGRSRCSHVTDTQNPRHSEVVRSCKDTRLFCLERD
jgi:hypothetical protein